MKKTNTSARKRPAATRGAKKPAATGSKSTGGKTLFDKRALFKKEIMPALSRLRALCAKHELPSVLSVCMRATDESCDMQFVRTVGPRGYMPRPFAHASHAIDPEASPSHYRGEGGGGSPLAALGALGMFADLLRAARTERAKPTTPAAATDSKPAAPQTDGMTPPRTTSG
jgi:hypothetical protein